MNKAETAVVSALFLRLVRHTVKAESRPVIALLPDRTG